MKRIIKNIFMIVLPVLCTAAFSACSDTVASIEPSFWFYLAFVIAAIAGIVSGLILMITVCVMKRKYKIQEKDKCLKDSKKI